jgi:uncharacterized protein
VKQNVPQPDTADMNTSVLFKRSPLAFYVLIFALSVPLWMAGFFVEVDGRPKNAQVTEFCLAFVPLLAASILVYREEKFGG